MNRPASRSPIGRVTQRIRSAVQNRLTGNADDDDSACLLDLYRENDSINNAETTPPEDENVDLRCVWAVEFYTPSHVDMLVDNLKKLGWDQNDLLGRESPASWIRTSRQYSEGGSWLNLGSVRSADDKRPWPSRDRTAPLPKQVRHARGAIYSFTPALLCIVLCFEFEDDFRCKMDEALRRRRQTFTRPVSRSGREIHDPERQKTDEVRQLRQEGIDIAAEWFRENLPGVFSSGLLGGQLPTCELLTLHKAEPFPDRDTGEYTPAGYLRVLGLEFSLSAWRSKDTPNLKFSLYLLGQNPEYHSAFVARTAGIEGTELLEAYGGLPGLTTYADSAYREMIGKVAIRPLLDGYSRRLNELRDTVTGTIQHPSRLKPSHTLQALVSNVAYNVDIPSVAADLISSTEESSWFFHHLSTFEPCYEWESSSSLEEVFRPAVNRHATRLNQTIQSLRDHLTQFGSLFAATENVRTQNLILVLTFIIVVLTLFTFVTGDLYSEFAGSLQGIWRHLRAWSG